MLNYQIMARHAAVAVLVSALCAGCGKSETEAARDAEGTETVHSPFDSGAWKSGDKSARGKMAHDLVDTGMLIGKTRDEVKSLLGEPDQEGRGFLAYFVASAAKGSPGPAYIVHIEFGRRGEHVKDARITADLIGDM